jgi:hypothetical protein
MSQIASAKPLVKHIASQFAWRARDISNAGMSSTWGRAELNTGPFLASSASGDEPYPYGHIIKYLVALMVHQLSVDYTCDAPCLVSQVPCMQPPSAPARSATCSTTTH